MFTVIKHKAKRAQGHGTFYAAKAIVAVLPRPLLNTVTALNMDRLSTAPPLRGKEVPTITVQDLTAVMQNEAR